jgi:hypothetical protein
MRFCGDRVLTETNSDEGQVGIILGGVAKPAVNAKQPSVTCSNSSTR